jgi:hypothetical protein
MQVAEVGYISCGIHNQFTWLYVFGSVFTSRQLDSLSPQQEEGPPDEEITIEPSFT